MSGVTVGDTDRLSDGLTVGDDNDGLSDSITVGDTDGLLDGLIVGDNDELS